MSPSPADQHRAAPVPDWFELRQRERRARRMARAAKHAPVAKVMAPVSDIAAHPNYPDCAEGTEPCWFARCRHSLLVDEENRTGIREVHPTRGILRLEETCSLRAARQRERSADEIAKLMQMSKQNVLLTLWGAFKKMAGVIDPHMLLREVRKKRNQE